MANVFDTAKYILEKLGEMSTMKLQKLCYYAQAWSLVWDDAPLFDEEFEAWANGPVCPELFYTIDTVLEHYGNHNAQRLSQLTHMEDPWNEARKGVPIGVGCSNIITKESMAMYYGGL